jgi:hypothetical protein
MPNTLSCCPEVHIGMYLLSERFVTRFDVSPRGLTREGGVMDSCLYYSVFSIKDLDGVPFCHQFQPARVKAVEQ